MKLIHNQMEYQINFEKDIVNTLIIESSSLLRSFILQLSNQIKGIDGGFVLSKGSSELKIGKNMEIILNPFIDSSYATKFGSRLIANIKSYAVNEKLYPKTIEIQSLLLEFASILSHEYNESIIFSEEIDLTSLIKLLGFSYDFEDSFLENIITYIRAINTYFNTNIFVFINLKSYLIKEELAYLFEVVKSINCHLVLIESYLSKFFINEEKRCIIDVDLCEIFNEG